MQDADPDTTGAAGLSGAGRRAAADPDRRHARPTSRRAPQLDRSARDPDAADPALAGGDRGAGRRHPRASRPESRDGDRASGPRACRWSPPSWPDCRAAEPTSSTAMPDELRRHWSADRLARLDPGARRLVAAAAVLGAPSTWSSGAGAGRARRGGGCGRLRPGRRARSAGRRGRRAALAARSGPGGRSSAPAARSSGSGSNRRAAELLLSLDSDDGDAAAADRLVPPGRPTGRPRCCCGWPAGRSTAAACAARRSCCERAAALGRPVEVALLQSRAADPDRPDRRGARRSATPALDAARHDEHAELCLRLARRRGRRPGSGRGPRTWSTRAGRPDDPRSLILLADAAHGAGRVAGGGRAGRARVSQARGEAPAEVAVRGALRARADPAA